MREVLDGVIKALLAEDITTLPMAGPDDIRAALSLLGRRKQIVKTGRARIDEILEHAATTGGSHPRHLQNSAAPYYRLLATELAQNAVQRQASSLLLDPDKIDWSGGGRYRSQEAELEHEALQRQVRQLEGDKLVAMRAVLANTHWAAPPRDRE